MEDFHRRNHVYHQATADLLPNILLKGSAHIQESGEKEWEEQEGRAGQQEECLVNGNDAVGVLKQFGLASMMK